MDIKRKNQLKIELLDKGEAIIEKRRDRLHQKHMSALKAHSCPKVNYQKKISFIEESIERDIEFFDNSNSTVVSDI